MIDNRLKIEVRHQSSDEACQLTACSSLTPQRAVLRGRYEVRQAMYNNKTNHDGGPAGQSRGLLAAQMHIPLESDVERGFAARARSHKRPNSGSGNKSGANAPGPPQAPSAEKALRRRKGLNFPPPAHGEVSTVPMPDVDDSTDSAARHRTEYANNLLQGPTPIESPDEDVDMRGSGPAPSGFSSALGASFQRLRTRSAPGMPAGFFSRTSLAPQASPQQEPRQHRDSTTNRFSRWLNPMVLESDSSSDEGFAYDGDEANAPAEGTGSEEGNILGTDAPGTGALGLSDTDEDGEVTVGGERVSPGAIEAAAAEGVPSRGA